MPLVIGSPGGIDLDAMAPRSLRSQEKRMPARMPTISAMSADTEL